MRTMSAAHELGLHAAPEGRSAREAHSDHCGAKGRAVEAAVRIYSRLTPIHADDRRRRPRSMPMPSGRISLMR